MSNFKVIITDNLGRETISDKLYQDNLTEKEALSISNSKNLEEAGKPHSTNYYKVVPMDYELWDASKLY